MFDCSTKDISTITSADLQNILSDNSDENMSRYAQSTMSSVEKIESATKEINAKLGVATFDNFVQTANNNVESMLNAYTSNLTEIANTVKQQRLDASKEQNELLLKLNSIFSEYQSSMSTITSAKIQAEEEFERLKAELEARDKEKQTNIAQTKTEQLDYEKLYNEAGNFITKAWYKGRLAEGKALLENGGERDSLSVKGLSAGMSGLGTFFTSLFDDGAISAQGQPMAVAASSVTPIHDGSIQLAKTDPQDSAIFAKTGGPFDTLFNGVFAKINEVAEILPKAMNYEMPTKDIVNTIKHTNSTTSTQNEKQSIDVNIHGDLRLNTDGKSIDISKLIETDPIFIRKITDLILTQIDDNVHGGRQSKMFHTRASVNFV